MRVVRCVAMLAVLAWAGCGESEVEDHRPNIVLLVAGDLGFSDIAPYGGEISTPSLDDLAGRGLRFSRYYVNSTPAQTKVSLLTGSYPEVAMEPAGALRKEAATATELLAQARYRTYVVGDSPAPAQTLDALSDQAVEHIRAAAEGRPFFLLVFYPSTEQPPALEEDLAHYQGDYAIGWDEVRARRDARLRAARLIPLEWEISPRPADVPAWARAGDQAAAQSQMEAHAARLERMDRGIGRILRALEDSGRSENSFVLFQAVTGASRDEMGPGWATAANTPFRGYQGDALEGGIRSPLVVRGPGIANPGGVVDEVAHAIDIAPTLLDIALRRPPRATEGRRLLRMEGKSLLPVFQGDGRRSHDALFWKSENAAAVRRDRWKLVRRTGEPWQLYDMNADGTEIRDESAGEPLVVQSLDRLFSAWEARRVDDLLQ